MIDKNNIPTSWEVVKLGEVCDKISLNGIKIKQKQYLSQGKFPVVDQGQELIGGYYNDEKLVVGSNPPYIIFGDHTKVKKFINFKFIAGADGVKVLKPWEIFYPKLFFYFIHSIKIPDKGYARHFQFLEKSEIPLPPLPEQHRIVSKIEELFTELDKGIETLKATQQQLKVYRQAVLKWAFEGRLTMSELGKGGIKDDKMGKKILKSSNPKNHNADKGDLPEGWEWKTLKEICIYVSDGDHLPPPKIGKEIPFITISNIEKNKIDFSNTMFMTKEYYEGLKENRKPQQGDILYTVTGSYGIPVLINFEKKFCFQRHIGLIRPKDFVNQKWLYYLLQSPQIFSQAKKTATGTAQKTVALSVLREFEIAYSSSIEQIKIVSAIESRLSVCDKMEETIESSLQQAEALRLSILKKTFEGKLVEQNAEDEPAAKLLSELRLARLKDDRIKKVKRKNKTLYI